VIRQWDRRLFIGGLALGVLALPRVVRAQPAPNARRVGILTLGVASDMIGLRLGPNPSAPS
jgi:hypothetical protein